MGRSYWLATRYQEANGPMGSTVEQGDGEVRRAKIMSDVTFCVTHELGINRYSPSSFE
jgi:hypothetical protein